MEEQVFKNKVLLKEIKKKLFATRLTLLFIFLYIAIMLILCIGLILNNSFFLKIVKSYYMLGLVGILLIALLTITCFIMFRISKSLANVNKYFYMSF